MNASGLIFGFLLTIAAISLLLLLVPTLLTLPIHSVVIIKLRRQWTGFLSEIYLDFAAVLLTILCGTRMYIYADSRQILLDEGPLIICNHRTKTDWMFAVWGYGSVIGANHSLKVTLKESLRYVPIFGWIMQLLMFIFLNRNRDVDIPKLKQILNYLLNCGVPPTIILFPEGTNLSKINVEHSNAFAKKNMLPELQHVLYPKPSGLAVTVEALRGRGLALHDITIAYTDYHLGQKNTLAQCVKGEFPKAVHLCVRRFQIDDLPTDRHELEKWLRDVFLFKEAVLEEFYSNGSAVRNTNDCTSKRKFEWPPMLHVDYRVSGPILRMLVLAIISFSAMYTFAFIRWISLWIVMLCICSRAVDGFDSIEILLHGNLLHQESIDEEQIDDELEPHEEDVNN